MLVWTLAKTSTAQVCGPDLPVLPWGCRKEPAPRCSPVVQHSLAVWVHSLSYSQLTLPGVSGSLAGSTAIEKCS